ncbi:GH1 family beta-glucosidase [Streptomyces sp. NBC_00576]|uniref:GH1 family beta-glucosidase n=1 Tax=Streptomyces sp. NBC_00576 TaxID=2903665 RepID=UPI002E807D2E|nr:GH1 family beta-glucosidase [Streptomyces sp. NBC_00576]WUB76752.1 GH1 family beta-glucosidase [Streptomyces sp. NBC_00576]
MNTPAFPMLPAGFRFGAATAAYQIEGAHDEDGRGPSIWDTFSHTPGRTLDGATGDTAADHYHRYPEDIALLRDLGVDSYRFSISWSRLLPEGTGQANPKGLDFYDRLIDELLAAGIAPAVTLYHWDLPQALEDRGGWRVRDTAEALAAYAALAAERYGDRVQRWITLNEPYCSAFVGHAEGRHAPGTREGSGALAAAHHLLVGHGLAVRALRAAGVREVGITLNLDRIHAASDRPEDTAARRRAETLHNDIWAEPLFAGRYPAHEAETWAHLADGPWRQADDLTVIGTPLDFVGLNYYRPVCVTAAPHQAPDPEQRTAVDIGVAETDPYGTRHTTMGWPVVPSAFTELLRQLHDRYPRLPPIWITENGSAEADTVAPDSHVHDDDRTRYLADHLQAVADAIAAGVDVRGHYVWSLLDNFEWARGYDQRFGLVRVDYDTQTRTPKDSYRWYRDLITAHRARTKDAR